MNSPTCYTRHTQPSPRSCLIRHAGLTLVGFFFPCPGFACTPLSTSFNRWHDFRTPPPPSPPPPAPPTPDPMVGGLRHAGVWYPEESIRALFLRQQGCEEALRILWCKNCFLYCSLPNTTLPNFQVLLYNVQKLTLSIWFTSE